MFLVGCVAPYILIVNVFLKGYVWRNLKVNQVKQPEGLISTLLDKSREYGDRHDAAMDLVYFWYDPKVTEALSKVKGDPIEDPDIVEEVTNTLVEIRRTKANLVKPGA